MRISKNQKTPTHVVCGLDPELQGVWMEMFRDAQTGRGDGRTREQEVTRGNISTIRDDNADENR